eukprot:ctg_174.g117
MFAWRFLRTRVPLVRWGRTRSRKAAGMCQVGGVRGCSTAMERPSWELPQAAAMRVYYSDVYKVSLPAGHRFPMQKYLLVRQALESRAAMRDVVFTVSPFATVEDLALVHDREYIRRFLQGQLSEKENRRIGFPWSLAGVQRTTASNGGTVAAMHDVLRKRCRFAGQLAGGTHHAFPDHGEGYCVFCDIAVATRVALRDYGHVRRVLIIDLDVHQGNGTAAIFANDDRVFTCSFHGHGNYPFVKQKSDLDVEFEDGTEDAEYLEKLEFWLPALFSRVRPQLVFFQAGVDALRDDRLGRLNLSAEGLRARNRMVFDAVLNSSDAGCVICMGGGYSDPIDKTVASHAHVYLDAKAALSKHYAGQTAAAAARTFSAGEVPRVVPRERGYYS